MTSPSGIRLADGPRSAGRRLRSQWLLAAVLFGLLVVGLVVAARGDAADSSVLDGFEGGKFRLGIPGAASGGLEVVATGAYQGRHAVRVTHRQSDELSYQRLSVEVDWPRETDVSYGVALYVPDASDWCWWQPVRWDNYQSYGSAGDTGGVRVEAGRLYVERARYGKEATTLVGPVDVPEKRWFWLEVRQRFSGVDGRALSELYLDGRLMGRSTAANSAGRPIDHIRFGNVAVASECSRSATMMFDRVSVSAEPRGPCGAKAAKRRRAVGRVASP